MGGNWLTTSEVGLIELFLIWKTYLGDPVKVSMFQWSELAVDTVTSAGTGFITKRDAYHADKSVGKKTAKNTAKVKLKKEMRSFATMQIRNNIYMSDADKTTMGLPPRDTHPTPVPVPETVPVITKMTPKAGQVVQIHFKDDTAEKSKAVPAGYTGAILNYVIAPTEVADRSLMVKRTLMNRSPFRLTLPMEARGAYLSCYPQWETKRSFVGPAGEVHHALIN
jgi:hypothetical protein